MIHDSSESHHKTDGIAPLEAPIDTFPKGFTGAWFRYYCSFHVEFKWGKNPMGEGYVEEAEGRMN